VIRLATLSMPPKAPKRGVSAQGERKNSSAQKRNSAQPAGVKGRKQFTLHRWFPEHLKLLKLAGAPVSPIEAKIDSTSATLSRQFARSALRQFFGTRPISLHVTGNLDLTSTGAGVINTTLSDATGLAGAQDWASLIAVFDEVYLRGVQICGHARNKYSKVTVLTNMIVMTHQDDEAPTTLTFFANNNTDFHVTNLDDMYPNWVTWMRPNTPATVNGWQRTNALTVLGGLSWYSNTLTATTTYGTLIIRYLVDFRMQDV